MTPARGTRRLRWVASGAAVGLLSLGVLAAAPSASAQSEAGPERDLTVRSVDATAYPTVTMVVTTPGQTSLDVTQNDQPVSALRSSSLDQADVSHLSVLVVDTSEAMATQAVLDHVVLGLKQVVLGKSPGELMALVTFGVSGRTSVPPTTDTAALLAGLDRLEASTRAEASRNEGIREALDLVQAAHVDVADLVVVSASTDSSSTVSDASVVGGLLGDHVVAHAIGIDLGDLDSAGLQRVARAVPSGSYVEASSPAQVAPALQATRASLDAMVTLTYTGASDATVLDIAVQGAGQQAHALLNAGARADGDALEPGSVDAALGRGPAFLRGADAKFLVLGLALVTFVLLAYGVFLIAMRESTDLESVLSHYDDRPVSIDEDDGDDPSGGMVQSKLLRQAVALTSRLAEQQGLLTKVEGMLERADLPLRPAEALFVYLAVVVVAGVAGFVLTGSPILALMIVLGAALLPPAFVNLKAGRRRAAFQAQLPDMLNLLAGSLRAGYSLMQGVEAVSREVQDPMGSELRRVVIEARLGRPLDEALDDCSKRMSSPDFAWTVMAINIQREVGGNLAELLLTVADTMVQRERLRRDVKSLTAEGRVSAVVLAILPPALMGAMYVVNPDYIGTLFTERTGNYLLGASTVLALIGFAWMKKLGKVEV